MSSAALIEPVDVWQSIEREGYTLRIDGERQAPLAFALSIAEGLDARPRRLDSSFLYDRVGSELFERITEQPEYYLTRAEDRLLVEHAPRVRELAGESVLVEFGSGASVKTQRLLDAWTAAGPSTYVPIDVDAESIEVASRVLHARYGKRLAIRGVAATYERALGSLCRSGPLTIAFLGSTLGNLGWQEYPEFCRFVADAMRPGDHFLVGLDLVKSPDRIEAAYNDAAGVTAAFTKNLFSRMNRELRTNVHASAVGHVAYYDSERERVEIFAEALREFTISVPAIGREFRIARGERIQTEVSHKFRPPLFVASLERLGLRAVWQGVGDGDFGLFLFTKPKGRARVRSVPDEGDEHLALLESTRTRTHDLVAPLGEGDLTTQHSPLMSPIAWDLGHIAQFEAEWLAPGAGKNDVADLYDPLVTPRAERAKLALPPVEAVFERLRSVRQKVRDRLGTKGWSGAQVRLPAGDFSLPLVIQHELQHQETMLQAIALRHDLAYRPRFATGEPASIVARAGSDRIFVPGGSFVMGTNDEKWAYDNERPAHERHVPAFWLGRTPVTNGAYFEFMADGGYRRRELWTAEGWAWVERTQAVAPGHWRLADRGAQGSLESWEVCTFGHLAPPYASGIVSHVSWYEADAYARWAGGRLPTEAEWEKAAGWDEGVRSARRHPWGDSPWSPERANLGQELLAPSVAGGYADGASPYGCLQMLGDVWEWTSTWFGGYPGFASFPYPEYSEVFFGERYRVLRGGAFATSPLVARNTFRNWDFPERRQIFSGFRCAWPA